MKRVHTVCLCVMLLLHGYCYAQDSPLQVFQPQAEKPVLFAALPDRFEVSVAALQKILLGEINEQINIQLSSQLLISGKIVDKSHQNPGTFSVNIKLLNYHNALFNLSAKLLADNSLLIQGRILHPKFGDVLILTKERDQYFCIKQSQKLFMPE